MKAPKEKALELIKRFHPLTYGAAYLEGTVGEFNDAKKCATYALEEMLELIEIMPTKDKSLQSYCRFYIHELKEEIKNIENEQAKV